MRPTRASSVLAVLLCAAATGVLRRRQAPTALTLDEAIAQGLANSLRLAELEARQDSAEALEQGRAAARRPSVAAQAGYTRTNHVDEFAIVQPGQLRQVVYPDVPDNFRTRLDLQWLFYTRRPRRCARARGARGAAGARARISRPPAPTCVSRSRGRSGRSSPRAKPSRCWRVRSTASAPTCGISARGSIRASSRRTSCCRRRRSSRASGVVSIEAANARGIAEADLRRLLGTTGVGADRARGAARRRRRRRRRCRSADRRRDRRAGPSGARWPSASRPPARGRWRPRRACGRRSG